MLKMYALVGVGGLVGSIARFAISRFFQIGMGLVFPYGTLLVNISGSMLIGIIYAFAEKHHWFAHEWRLLLGVGFCGGFTTFSSFSYEVLSLLKNNQIQSAMLYIAGSLFLGILAVAAGYYLTRQLV